MNTSKLTAVLLITLGVAGFGAGLSVAASPDAKHKPAHHQGRKAVTPPRIVGYAPDRTASVTAAKAKFDLTPNPATRYAEADQQRPIAGRSIHYDATPSGFPANVDTVGVVRKF